MIYLVDTNVLSEGAPTKSVSRPELVSWLDRHSEKLFLSAVTIAEIEAGIAKCRRQGAARKAGHLTAWLDTLLHLYTTRVLPLDVPVARAQGRLSDYARALGHTPGFADLAIAATAQHHGCTVLTRNLRHFACLGVPAANPFDGLPA